MSSTPSPVAAFEAIADVPCRERFCILHPAQAPRRGAIVHVHAFAEEMNRTRRMVSEQARQLARVGFEVLLLDLYGCGDSPGDFGEATWDRWLADVRQGAQWMRARPGAAQTPLWLWGTRLGALLATAASAQVRPDGLLFWQPVADGAQHLQQFLRVADTQLAKGRQDRSGSTELLDQLARGQAVEVAGYRLSAAMFESLQPVRLETLELGAARVLSIESAAGLNVAGARNALEHHPDAGRLNLHRIGAQGPAFWMQVDADDAPDWWRVTTAAMLAAQA